MTTTPHAPLTILPTPGAEHVGEWELSEDDRIAHRHFHCGERTTPGGLLVLMHGLQYADGGLDGLGIALSDEHGDVIVDGVDVEALADNLSAAVDELDQLAK